MIARFFTYRAMAALVALALISIAQPVTAQTQTPGPEPSLASVLIAKQIVEIKGVRQMFEPLVHGVIQKVKAQFLQTNIMWAKDINEIAAKMQADFEPRGGELVDATARIYASHFTEEELKGILTFYQSPLGKKMIIEEPRALDEAMINAGEWGDTLSEEVIAKMRAEMKKRGHDL